LILIIYDWNYNLKKEEENLSIFKLNQTNFSTAKKKWKHQKIIVFQYIATQTI
jgi:uncharacterized protein involved in tolerance to divalent cations